jgi:hypothetical protein
MFRLSELVPHLQSGLFLSTRSDFNKEGGEFKTSAKGKEYQRAFHSDRIRWRDVEPDTKLDKSQYRDYDYARSSS